MIQSWPQIQIVDGEPSEPILFVARNTRHVVEWCLAHRVNPDSRNITVITRDRRFESLPTMINYYVYLGTDDQDLKRKLHYLDEIERIKPLNVPDL